ncbi:FecR domain-containing protein [Oxalobacteraceae bacterium]|nr:FecR domain-containing protein [Oxalobacteraceae bacterium]
MLLAGAVAHAGEAGRIVFVSGAVHSGARPVAMGDAIAEGDELATGKDGYVYLKTSDDGLLILRPSSRARIAAYHVDLQNPANTRVKLELLSGVARSVSGNGVKQARQNFRFNTPVAAIGVRGTDFTVFTDQETSNVTVLSGAIVVSGFSGACLPAGGGPCEHAASRELSAGQVGQMLQVKRGQPVPQLLSGSGIAPDSVVPPRGDEPPGKSGGSASLAPGELILDPQKASALLKDGVLNKTDLPVTPQQPTVAPADPVQVVPSTPVASGPASELKWGRWTAVVNQPATIDNAKLVSENAVRMGQNSYYSVLRTKGADWEAPVRGSASFVLRGSEVLLTTDSNQSLSAAKLENGTLQVDFGKASFTTGFDVVTSSSERFSLQSVGVVGRDGALSGGLPYITKSNMGVSGALGPENNAAYVFSSRLDQRRVVDGVTYWTK